MHADVLQHLGHRGRRLVEGLAVVLGREVQVQQQRLAVALPAAARVLPPGLGQQRLGAFRIERVRLLRGVAGRHGGDGRGVHDRVALEDLLDDRVAVHRVGERQARLGVAVEPVLAAGVELVLGPAVEVEAAVELLGAGDDLHVRLAREHGGVERRHRVHEGDLPGAQPGQPRGRLGDHLQAQPLHQGQRTPVGVVALQDHGRLAPPLHELPGARADGLVVERVDAVLDRPRLRHERLAPQGVPERGGGLARVHAHRIVVDLLPAAHVRQGLVELRAGGHVLDPVLVEVAPEHAVEVEEHGVGVERLAVVELHAPAQAELPRRVAHRLPGQGQPGHGLALRVDVDEALEDLADVGRADRAHADPRVHVGGVVGHRHHQLGLGIGRRLGKGGGGEGENELQHGQPADHHALLIYRPCDRRRDAPLDTAIVELVNAGLRPGRCIKPETLLVCRM